MPVILLPLLKIHPLPSALWNEYGPLECFLRSLHATRCQQRALEKHRRRKPGSCCLVAPGQASGKLTFFLHCSAQDFPAVLVARGVQLSLAFIPPTPSPVFDWVWGVTAWSPRAGLCPSSNHCSLHLLLNLVCAPQEGTVGLTPSEPLAQPVSHVALKMPQKQVIRRAVLGSFKRGPSSAVLAAPWLFSVPALHPWLTCSSKLIPGGLQTHPCVIWALHLRRSPESLCPPAPPPQLPHLPEAVSRLPYGCGPALP